MCVNSINKQITKPIVQTGLMPRFICKPRHCSNASGANGPVYYHLVTVSRLPPIFAQTTSMELLFDLNKPVAVGADHAGFDYKTIIIELLQSKGLAVNDLGTYSADSVDYPDFAHPVANAVERGEAGFGILVCGSGNGVAITANKHQGIRAALCWTEELAGLSRTHNNANILCIPCTVHFNRCCPPNGDSIYTNPFRRRPTSEQGCKNSLCLIAKI
jgi:ribose 5-phosphate isomerase B